MTGQALLSSVRLELFPDTLGALRDKTGPGDGSPSEQQAGVRQMQAPGMTARCQAEWHLDVGPFIELVGDVFLISPTPSQ